MKTTLVVVQDEAYQEAYREADGVERSQGPCTDGGPGPLGRGLRALGVATYSTDSSSSSRVPNGPAWPFACRSHPATWHSQPRERGPERKAGLEHDNGAPTPRALLHLSRFARSAGSNAQQNSCVSLPAKIHDSYATTRYAIESNGNSYQCKRPTFHGLEAPAFNWR
jgi:hypothetical protein